MNRFVLIPILLGLILAPSLGRAQGQDYTGQINQQEGMLREIREKLAASRARADSLKREEGRAYEELEQVEQNLELAQRLIATLKKQEGSLVAAVEILGHELEITQTKLTQAEGIRAQRIRSIYKHGRLHDMTVLLSSRSFVDAFVRYKYLNLISGQDRRLVTEIRDVKAKYEQDRDEQEKKLAELAQVRAEKEREEQAIQDTRNQAAALVRQVRTERVATENAVKELEASARRLEGIIAKLEKERKEALARKEITPTTPGSEYLERHVGGLAWPVSGVLVTTFGTKTNPKYGTQVRSNGIEIKAPYGTPVKAVAQGKVVYAERFLGYGKVVLIDHGGGFYSLYGHLAEIIAGLGTAVREHETVATVGDSGSLEGARLYFELRQNGKPVDPLGWLTKH